MIHYEVEVENLCRATTTGAVTFHGVAQVETDGCPATRVARHAVVVELEYRGGGKDKVVFELSLPWVSVDAVECSNGLAVSAWPIARLGEAPPSASPSSTE